MLPSQIIVSELNKKAINHFKSDNGWHLMKIRVAQDTQTTQRAQDRAIILLFHLKTWAKLRECKDKKIHLSRRKSKAELTDQARIR